MGGKDPGVVTPSAPIILYSPTLRAPSKTSSWSPHILPPTVPGGPLPWLEQTTYSSA